MFDDLRSQVSPFDEEGEQPAQPQRASKTAKPAARTGSSAKAAKMESAAVAAPVKRRVVRKKKKVPSEMKLLGMTAVQRFVLSIMMFMIVAVFGLVLLLVTGSMVLPL